MSSERNPLDVIPLWLEATADASLPATMKPDAALAQAAKLRETLRATEAAVEPTDVDPNVFHALFEILYESDDEPRVLLNDACRAHKFLSGTTFPDDAVGERDRLLASFAFVCWRAARLYGSPADAETWARRLEVTCKPDLRIRAIFDRAMSIPVGDVDRFEPHVADPVTVFALLRMLQSAFELAPSRVRAAAENLYSMLKRPPAVLSIDVFRIEERDYCSGESARIAGTACRLLARWDQAERWFDLADIHFEQTHLAEFDLCRVEYQRLAVAAEQRSTKVLQRARELEGKFRQLGMNEEALKCSFLEGSTYFEAGDVDRARHVHRRICEEAELLNSPYLLAQAEGNLASFGARSGDVRETLIHLDKAVRLLRETGNQVGTVKLLWSMGEFFRRHGRFAAALGLLRRAQFEAEALGVRSDLVAVRLACADLLMEANRQEEAEAEIRAALPIIDEEKMVPEGIAALSLLRESLHRRQIDKQALRDLHGYFREK